MEQTKDMIKSRLKQAKQQMECWELSVQDYNKFVKLCRKLLSLLNKKQWTN